MAYNAETQRKENGGKGREGGSEGEARRSHQTRRTRTRDIDFTIGLRVRASISKAHDTEKKNVQGVRNRVVEQSLL